MRYLVLFSLALSLAPLFAQESEEEREQKHRQLLRDLLKAGTYFETKDYENAIKQYDAILTQYPDHLEAELGKMATINKQKGLEETLKYGKKLKGKTKAESLDALILDGVAHLYQKDLKSAGEVFAKATTAFPEEGFLAYYHLGFVKFMERQMDAAIPLLEKARDLNPDYSDTYYVLGDVYYFKKDKQKAQANWYKFLELAPSEGGRYERVKKIIKSWGGG